MRISVKVQPRATKEEIVENKDGSLKVYLRETPTDGKANRSLIAVLSYYYRVRKTDIRIIAGQTSRRKIIEVIKGG